MICMNKQKRNDMGNKKPSCFIIMPFDKEFKKVYEDCIKSLVEEKLGMECIRIDEWPSCKKTVIDNIKTNIDQCLFAIADLSLDKPNVYYEVGLAHAIGKDVVFIKNKQLDDLKLPFDISPWHAFVYDKDATSYEKLFEKIIKMIRRDFSNELKTHRPKKKTNSIVGGWKGEYKIKHDGRLVSHEVELIIVSKGRIYEAFSKIVINHNVKLIQNLKYHYKLTGKEWENGDWIEFIGDFWGNDSTNLKDYWLDAYAINKNTDGESLQVKIWDRVNTEKKEVIFERIS